MGAGTSLLPARLNCPPEITLAYLAQRAAVLSCDRLVIQSSGILPDRSPLAECDPREIAISPDQPARQCGAEAVERKIELGRQQRKVIEPHANAAVAEIPNAARMNAPHRAESRAGRLDASAAFRQRVALRWNALACLLLAGRRVYAIPAVARRRPVAGRQ